MLNKLNNIKNLIGNTPLIKIYYKYNNKIKFMYAKLEWYNLSGSIKDRPAFCILKNGIIKKQINKDTQILETTSGNMGISICQICNLLNLKTTIFMPKNASKERVELLKLYGANLILCDNFNIAINKCFNYKKENIFLPKQFENKFNVFSHFKTAEEICLKIQNPKCFVSGVGTGGTLMGVGKILKQKYNSKIIAIEPSESQILINKKPSSHLIEGISDEFIPLLYNSKIVDKIIPINSADAVIMAKKLCSCLGLNVGISSGANFLGCVLSNINGTITVFSDDSKKYLSTFLTFNKTSTFVDNIKLLYFKYV